MFEALLQYRMAQFEQAVAVVLQQGGGYVPGPADDPGSATHYGISMGAWQDYAGTATPIQNITSEQAQAYYRDTYWTPHLLGSLSSQAVATGALVAMVSLGTSDATQLLEHALSQLQGPQASATGGVWSAATVAAINAVDAPSFYAVFTSFWRNFYQTLAETHPYLDQHLAGWLDKIPPYEGPSAPAA